MGRKDINSRDFVAVNSIAGYCMVSPTTVRRWIKEGRLNALKLPSGRFRVSAMDLINFLKQNNMPICEELMDSN